MPQNRDLESLIDITFYGRQALSFVDNLTQDEFEMDDKTQAAMMYAIAILSASKAGGIELVKVLTNNHFISVPLETVKGWLEAEAH